jgi:hypothetical protein
MLCQEPQKDSFGKDYFSDQEERFHGVLATNTKDTLIIFMAHSRSKASSFSLCKSVEISVLLYNQTTCLWT